MTQVATDTAKLAPETRLGAVELTVTDLDRSVSFYEDAIGLRTHSRADERASLGAEPWAAPPLYERLYSNGRAYLRPEDQARISSVVKGWGRSPRRRQAAAATPRRAAPDPQRSLF